MTARFVVGDTRKVLASLPDASVDLVRHNDLSSGQPSEGLEIGSEATPDRELHRAHPEQPCGPPLDWWEIPTQPYSGSHYATFPERLVTRPIEAMCPREVCTVCGEPRRRLVDVSYVDSNGNPAPKGEWKSGVAEGLGAHSLKTEVRTTTTTTTTGWSECGCSAPFRRGIVLDPFAGSGTTLAVAEGLGRDSIGIDLDERNADLARERVGMFLAVESGLRFVAQDASCVPYTETKEPR